MPDAVGAGRQLEALLFVPAGGVEEAQLDGAWRGAAQGEVDAVGAGVAPSG